MLTEITTLAGIVGLLVSIGLLTWQTRAVAQQTKISNSLNGHSVVTDILAGARELLLEFIEHPELRPYFYEKKNIPRKGRRRRQVISLAEAFCDVLESGLFKYRVTPAADSLDIWIDYCSLILSRSPVIDGLARNYPQWWPELSDLSDRAGQRQLPPGQAEDMSRMATTAKVSATRRISVFPAGRWVRRGPPSEGV
jgi:hypothetical protein